MLGKKLLMDGDPFVIVGVMPPSFQFPDKRTQIWTPLAVKDEAMKANRGGFWLHVLGKLKPGATIEQARAEMTLIGTNLERQYPNTNAGYGTWVVPSAGASGGRAAERAARVIRRGRLRAADRVRQRSEPVSRARRGAGARNRGAYRPGRRPRPPDSATADREFRVRGARGHQPAC